MKELLDYVNKTLQNSKKGSDIAFKTALKDGGELVAYLRAKKNSQKLYVMFNGALNRDRETPYSFHRWSWHNLFDGSVLYIADASLIKYSNLRLAWYSGIRSFDFLDFITYFISQVSTFLGATQIITYGSSNGGYTSLQVASRIGKSATAVAINPQTVIWKYEIEPVKQFFKTCFDIDNIQSYYDYLTSAKFNAIKAIEASQCKVLYIQNTRDVFHYNNHYSPFMQSLGISLSESSKVISDQENTRIKSYIYSHRSGHGPETKDLVKDIIDMVNFMNKGVYNNG
ncbi:hypothetical protein [Mannheimia indoligenes]|uniref:hypothetical protein n=1 Tax=Mannheimia indoligenes TaxID=3103145 RepID=UPI002FE65F7E